MKSWQGLVAGAALWAVAGCAAGVGGELPRPDELPTTAGEMTFLLAWRGEADLDLYVTDPTQETVYFANSPTRTGGELRDDARCGEAPSGGAPRVEVVTWPDVVPGRYRVGVDFSKSCDGKTETVRYRIAVRYGSREEGVVGDARHLEFDPVALEIDVPLEVP